MCTFLSLVNFGKNIFVVVSWMMCFWKLIHNIYSSFFFYIFNIE